MWNVLPFAISLVSGYFLAFNLYPVSMIKACDSRIRIHWDAVVQGKWKQISRKKNGIRANCTVHSTLQRRTRVFSLLTNRTKIRKSEWCYGRSIVSSSYAYEWKRNQDWKMFDVIMLLWLSIIYNWRRVCDLFDIGNHFHTKQSVSFTINIRT